MAIGRGFFRTRSLDRDNTSDELRRLAVRSSVEHALQEAQRELAGLERRIDAALMASVSLMDNSGDYGERAAEDEQDITEFEQQAQRGRLRAAALRKQVARYSQVLAVLEQDA